MGLIGKVLSFVRVTRNGANVSDVKFTAGGGRPVTAENYSPIGDDAQPLPGDYSFSVPAPQRGRFATLGYVDPANTPKAQPGERRIYARDADTGSVVVELWLKNDGSVEIVNDSCAVILGADGSILGENLAGQFELETGGDFVANGARMTVDGDVQTSDGISLRDHPHNQGSDSGGDAEVPTDPPTPTA